MRILSLAALSALLLAGSAHAQVTFGVRAGLNTAFLSGDSADGLDPRLGFAGGAILRFDATPGLAIQAEALYSQEGAKESDGIDEGTYQFDYLEIPILARVGIPLSPYADAGVFVGPSIGIPISGRFDSDLSDAADLDLDDAMNTDIGLTFGADYWSGPFGIDLRFTTGLTDAYDGVGLGDARNQTFTVTAGYRFGGTYGRNGRRY